MSALASFKLVERTVRLCFFLSPVVFVFGSSMYIKTDPKGNIMLEVCKCIWVSHFAETAHT